MATGSFFEHAFGSDTQTTLSRSALSVFQAQPPQPQNMHSTTLRHRSCSPAHATSFCRGHHYGLGAPPNESPAAPQPMCVVKKVTRHDRVARETTPTFFAEQVLHLSRSLMTLPSPRQLEQALCSCCTIPGPICRNWTCSATSTRIKQMSEEGVKKPVHALKAEAQSYDAN